MPGAPVLAIQELAEAPRTRHDAALYAPHPAAIEGAIRLMLRRTGSAHAYFRFSTTTRLSLINIAYYLQRL
jgi:hypothetical protein